jgi:hypothetical protein
VCFFFMFLVHAAIPELVVVRKERVQIIHGQSSWVARAGDIRWTRIVIFAPDRIRLRIAYTRGCQRKTRTVGVGRNVDLDELSTTLPIPPQVWDARGRYDRIRLLRPA